MWYPDVELYVVNLTIIVSVALWLLSFLKHLGFLRPLALVAVCLGAGLYLGIEATARGYIAVPIAGSQSDISLQDKKP